jgi:serine/threonine protein kinase
VMELCELGSLMDVIEKEGLSYSPRLALAQQACLAVAHLHELGFVHRDIKSLNYFCTRREAGGEEGKIRVLLGDFGETLPQERSVVEVPSMIGTMEWMSPEIMLNWQVEKGLIAQDEGCAYVDSADTFSVAVVVWECATGQMPYEGLRDEKGEEVHPIDKSGYLKARVPQGLRPAVNGSTIPDGDGGTISESVTALIKGGWRDLSQGARLTCFEMAQGIKAELAVLRRNRSGTLVQLETFTLQVRSSRETV